MKQQEVRGRKHEVQIRAAAMEALMEEILEIWVTVLSGNA